MGGKSMRSSSICLVVLTLVIILICQPVAALPVLSIPYARIGPCFYLNPSEVANLVILEKNSSHMVTDDSEAFAISFVPSGAGFTGGLNVAPVIAQTSSRTIAGDRTYFFRDFSVP